MIISSFSAYELFRNGDWSYFKPEQFDMWMLFLGLTVLAAGMLPRLLSKKLVTAPVVYLLFGLGLYFLIPQDKQLNLAGDLWAVERLTELVVSVALTGAGLKLNKPFARSTWRYSKRLLLIAMPLTMIFTFALGYWIFGFATAALLAAVIAPTDPVLAADVQTSAPSGEDGSPTRVALTAEAGVNDSLAFPFTYLAIGLAIFATAQTDWLWSWFVMDFVYKIVVGVLIGLAVGWLLNKSILAFPAKKEGRVSTGILTMALTFMPYGLAEMASSYGFVAVFAAACVFRNLESRHDYQEQLHAFSEEIERFLVAVIFVFIGMSVGNGLIPTLTWRHILFATALIFAVRPIAGMAGLMGMGLHRLQKFTMSFYGIRGIGSLYYLTYAINNQIFPGAEDAFALVVFLMIASAVIHGLSAPMVTTRLDVVEREDIDLGKAE